MQKCVIWGTFLCFIDFKQFIKPFISQPPELEFSPCNSAKNSNIEYKAQPWCIWGCAEMRSSHGISKIKRQVKVERSDRDTMAKAKHRRWSDCPQGVTPGDRGHFRLSLCKCLWDKTDFYDDWLRQIRLWEITFDTCIFPGTPVLSILLATLTVFPQMSYWGRRAPITPATTGPTLMPVQNMQSKSQTWNKWNASVCTVAHVRTDSEHKLVVGLIVDLIQNVKHLNGVVCYGAQVVIHRFFCLKVRWNSHIVIKHTTVA